MSNYKLIKKVPVHKNGHTERYGCTMLPSKVYNFVKSRHIKTYLEWETMVWVYTQYQNKLTIKSQLEKIRA